jgi:hypothetical protein
MARLTGRCSTDRSFAAMKNQAVLFGVVLLLVSAVAYGVVAVAEDSIPARSFEYPPETVSAVQTMSTEVHAGSKTSQQQQQQQKESETTTAEKDSVKEGSEPAAVHANFARTSSRTAREDATTPSTSATVGVTQDAKLSGDKEVKPNNYPNFEFTTGSTVKSQEEPSDATTEKASASNGAQEEKSTAEVKPNNYPNFEFTQQSKVDSKQTTQEAATSTEPEQSTSNVVPEEVKPNNYPNFEFKQSSSSSQSASAAGSRNLPFVNGYDEQEAKKFGAQFGQASATESKDKTTSSHTVDQSTTSAAVLSSEKTVASSSSESQSSSTDTSAFWTDIPTATYRGSDPSGKYPSSFDLTNARKNGASSSSSSSYRGSDPSGKYPSSFDLTNARKNGASSSSSTSYRGSDPSGRHPSSFDLTNTRYQTQQQTQQQKQQQQQHADSFQPDTELFTNFQPDDGQQFFARNPSLVPDQSAYRFGDTTSRTSSSSSSATQDLSKTSTTFGDNQFQTQDPVDQSVYSQFTNSRPSSSSKINEAGPDTKATTTGCSTSSYWSTHTESWPKFFVSTRSLVTDAFGTRAGTAYGTTTMLQALNDGRFDAFSELANHGVAALLNAYTKPTSYQFSHTVVIDQFNRALVSRTAAAVQAKVFENANNAYGTENCKV